MHRVHRLALFPLLVLAACSAPDSSPVESVEESELRERKRLKIRLTDEMAEDVRDYAGEHPEKMAEMMQAWITQED